jgi:hypothetical protein
MGMVSVSCTSKPFWCGNGFCELYSKTILMWEWFPWVGLQNHFAVEMVSVSCTPKPLDVLNGFEFSFSSIHRTETGEGVNRVRNKGKSVQISGINVNARSRRKSLSLTHTGRSKPHFPFSLSRFTDQNQKFIKILKNTKIKAIPCGLCIPNIFDQSWKSN